jgi:hypothetical protein
MDTGRWYLFFSFGKSSFKILIHSIFTSEIRLISSIWLVNIDNMPACVLTVSISEMLIAFTNEIKESLAFALSFLFNSYSWFVILLLFFLEIFIIRKLWEIFIILNPFLNKSLFLKKNSYSSNCRVFKQWSKCLRKVRCVFQTRN